jgi:hypothetical protein
MASQSQFEVRGELGDATGGPKVLIGGSTARALGDHRGVPQLSHLLYLNYAMLHSGTKIGKGIK